jgi:hypothetical protein
VRALGRVVRRKEKAGVWVRAGTKREVVWVGLWGRRRKGSIMESFKGLTDVRLAWE